MQLPEQGSLKNFQTIKNAADTRTRARICAAKTRAGHPCRTPAMPNGRCRMHGGTNPGAPKGNRNGWKHGLRSAEHRALRLLLRTMRDGLDSFA
jgi:hypothetical protein